MEVRSGTLPHLEMFTTSPQFICERISGIWDDQYEN